MIEYWWGITIIDEEEIQVLSYSMSTDWGNTSIESWWGIASMYEAI